MTTAPPPLNKLPPSLSSQNYPTNANYTLLTEPNAVNAGAAMQWIGDAWQLLKQDMGVWVGAFAVTIVAMILASFIPVVNLFVSLFAQMFLTAGFAYMTHQKVMGNAINIGQAFEGFRKNTGQLLMIGLLYFVGIVICLIPAMLMGALGGALFGSGKSMSAHPSPMAGIWLFLVMLVMFIFVSLLMMATWLSPVLVMLHDIKAFDAMKLSFKACLRNIIPLLVLGIIGFIITLIGIIPFGLGLLITAPLMMITTYVCYRAMLTNSPLS